MIGKLEADAPPGVEWSRAARPDGHTGREDGVRLGWALVLGPPLAGAALGAGAVGGGAAAWLPAGFLALALAAGAAYGALSWLPGRRSAALLAAAEARARGAEERLRAAFEHLGAGDLVRAGEGAGALPGAVGQGLTAAAAALSGLAERIQTSSTDVAAASEAVHHISSELASGASQQAASVVEITAAMEELARTASQIAASATLQAELAAQAEANGDLGARAVEEAATGVDDVRRRISGIAARADELGSRSKEIYRVLDLITEIADETHVLSLNAAIEGAAAGAGGRRFAVVAEEVRRLAHRSRESVDSVRGLLDEFSGSIRAVIVATEEGGKEGGRVAEGTRSASGAIAALREVAGDTSRVAREISLATRQQNAASDEVVLTLKEVSQVVQRMGGGLRDLSATADRLNRLGLSIQMLAQSFHLDSPRSLKHTVEEWCAALAAFDDPREIERAVEERVQSTPFIELGYYVDARGYTVAWTPNHAVLGPLTMRGVEWAREIDMRRRPWYQAAVRGDRPILTPLYPSVQSGVPCFTVAAPVRRGGELAGVLGVDVNLGAWRKI